MGYVGLDIGTTHWKAGMVGAAGALLTVQSGPTPLHRARDGCDWYDPEALWRLVVAALRGMAATAGEPIEGIGVASMAESGLLVDWRTGEARTWILPWFDRRPQGHAEEIGRQNDPMALFQRSGLRCSVKYGLPKLLWLRDEGIDLSHAVWLSVADYIVFRLTGRMVTDPTLAVRTFLYDLPDGRWDEAWMADFGLRSELFPEILPSGTPAGTLTPEASAATGLGADVTAAVAGHDHLCALLAAGVTEPGPVLDSIGTAESVMGALAELDLGEAAFKSDLSIVPHVLPGQYCWLGGMSSAGGAIEWLRGVLAEQPVSYEQINRLARTAGPEPTGILFMPYLSGSGAPWHDERVRGAFLGLDAAHGSGHLVRAVLEGTAYATESIRRAAEGLTGCPINAIVAVGGGTRNEMWMQIRADVCGCAFSLPNLSEAVVSGAALAAALGRGAISGTGDIAAIARARRDEGTYLQPNKERHGRYSRIFDDGFMAMQEPLRRLGRLRTEPEEGFERMTTVRVGAR